MAGRVTSKQLIDTMISHCERTGWFDRVNTHEPKNAPGRGLTAAIWVERIDPVARVSGLAVTSVRFELFVRIYSNMLQEPADAIDPNISQASLDLMESISEGFRWEDEIFAVDLAGAYGQALSGQSGYLQIDNKTFRVMTVRVPLILDDLWEQVA